MIAPTKNYPSFDLITAKLYLMLEEGSDRDDVSDLMAEIVDNLDEAGFSPDASSTTNHSAGFCNMNVSIQGSPAVPGGPDFMSTMIDAVRVLRETALAAQGLTLVDFSINAG